MFGFSSLATSLIGAAVIAIIAAGGGAWGMHKIDQGSYQTLEAKFATYQTDQAKAEAQTRINDLAAYQKAETKLQGALDVANAKIAMLEQQRAAAAQALSDTLDKEGKANVPLGKCLAMPLPADVLQQLTH